MKWSTPAILAANLLGAVCWTANTRAAEVGLDDENCAGRRVRTLKECYNGGSAEVYIRNVASVDADGEAAYAYIGVYGTESVQWESGLYQEEGHREAGKWRGFHRVKVPVPPHKAWELYGELPDVNSWVWMETYPVQAGQFRSRFSGGDATGDDTTPLAYLTMDNNKKVRRVTALILELEPDSDGSMTIDWKECEVYPGFWAWLFGNAWTPLVSTNVHNSANNDVNITNFVPWTQETVECIVDQ